MPMVRRQRAGKPQSYIRAIMAGENNKLNRFSYYSPKWPDASGIAPAGYCAGWAMGYLFKPSAGRRACLPVVFSRRAGRYNS